jgi:predicted transcriptional regulator
MLIASIAISILMSAIVVSKILSDQVVNMYSMSTENSLSRAPSSEPADKSTDTRESAPSGEGTYGGGSGGSAAPPYSSPQANLALAFYSPIHESAEYILPIAWGAVAGALIWRGKVRSAWSKQGYDYETFRLVARMRGSPIRVKLLTAVTTAKNRLQLANELDVDWKTIDNHMEILTRSGFVEEKAIVGTTRYYVLTEHGRRILSLLADGGEPATIPEQEHTVGALGT